MSDIIVRVNKIPGEMPPVWQRQVVFLANLFALFYGNEAQTDVLRKEVGTFDTYSIRLVPILNLMFRGASNMLILERKPNTVLIRYFQEELGLTIPEIKVLANKDYISLQNDEKSYSDRVRSLLNSLSMHSSKWIDGYVTDEMLERIARLTRKTMVTSIHGSRRGNNKYLLYEHIRSKGLPVFDTCVAETARDVQNALKYLEGKGYSRAVLKSQVGASGVGMQKINLKEELKEVPDYIFYEGPCLVQGWLDSSLSDVQYIDSPSVQMFLNEESVNLYDLTEQLLSHESVHQGNIAPPRHLIDDKDTIDEILHQAEVAGTWLHAQGYRGAASCDLHIVDRLGCREVRLCEINARVTGATYPSFLSRHFLPQGAWLMRNIRFSPPVKDTFLLQVLDKHSFLFHTGKQEGILPCNFNFDREGDIVKGQFLFISETTQRVSDLLKELCSIPSIHSSFDRD